MVKRFFLITFLSFALLAVSRGVFAEEPVSTTSPLPDPYIPTLNVPIPGLNLEESVSNDANVIVSSTLGLYIEAIYRYLIVAGAVIAVVMVTVGGFQYMTAGGSKKGVTQGKERITQALIGLVLLFAAYTIAYLIDPRTTLLSPISLERIDNIELEEYEDENITPAEGVTGETSAITGNFLSAGNTTEGSLNPEALIALQQATDAFNAETGKHTLVASGFRSPVKQATIFYNNCLANDGYCAIPTCNLDRNNIVKSGSRYVLTGQLTGLTEPDEIIAGIVKYGYIGNCPHTSGLAVDAWCAEGQRTGYIADPVCQEQLIQKMIAHGFCRLASEPWHFEWPSSSGNYLSSTCSQGNASIAYTRGKTTYSPPSSCSRWSFKKHTCVVTKNE